MRVIMDFFVWTKLVDLCGKCGGTMLLHLYGAIIPQRRLLSIVEGIAPTHMPEKFAFVPDVHFRILSLATG